MGATLPSMAAMISRGGGLGGVFDQAVAALAAPLALDQPGAGQGRDQLLEVFQAELLALADLFQGHGAARRGAGQLSHQAQAVPAFGGKSHPVTSLCGYVQYNTPKEI